MENKQDEIVRLCRRFEIAVGDFGHSCIAMRANEKAFQAWFAASVIQEFGMSRVYREIHLAKKELSELTKGIELAQEFNTGNELFPDLSISWLPDIDARHSNTREQSVRSAGDLLLRFAIITELKVTGSSSNSTPVDQVARDIKKLAVFSSAHAAHRESTTDGDGDGRFLKTYMVVLDNFSNDEGTFKSAYSAIKLKKLFEKLAVNWPDHVDKPTILVISSMGLRASMTVYRGFEEEKWTV